MKKIAIFLIIVAIAFLQISCKTDTVAVPFTATWYQEIPDQVIFGGWEIYMANSEKGTYSLAVKIPFSAMSESGMYSYTATVDIPENTNTKRWFKIRAYNKDGGKSGWSNVTYKLIQT